MACNFIKMTGGRKWKAVCNGTQFSIEKIPAVSEAQTYLYQKVSA